MKKFMQVISAISFSAAAFIVHSNALAQVTVKDAWVRGTVAQQKATGAFMTITSAQDAKLISVSSKAAKSVELHTMEMENNVMKMRQIDSVNLTAGKAVELKPGGMHIMLMGLNEQAKDGDVINFTLVVEGKDKKQQSIEVKATVKALGTPKPAASAQSNAHSGH
jgi:copper(I)-binding protein